MMSAAVHQRRRYTWEEYVAIEAGDGHDLGALGAAGLAGPPRQSDGAPA